MPNTPHSIRFDLQEATTRNDLARSIVIGFASALPTLARFWEQLDAALADTPALIAELTDARQHYANLAAAGLATLAAHSDGEPDPLFYLRDELAAQSHAPERGRA